MNKIFAMLPCYNEEENIEQLLNKWLLTGEKLRDIQYKLVIVGIDDKSTDNTLAILHRLAAEFSEIVVIEHMYNLGLGGGLKTAFRYFMQNGELGDYCVIMDGDNSHDPKYLFSMIRIIDKGNYDCIIASRYCNNSETIGVPRFRLLLTFLAKAYYKCLLHVPNVNDYTCGYRLYSYGIVKKAMEKFEENLITHNSFACMMEVLYKLYLVGCRFSEVPFSLRYDAKKGKSKMKIFRTIKESIFTAIDIKLL